MTDKRKTFLIEPPAAALPASLMFLRHARFRLLEDYFVKIAAAIDALDDEQVWRRPNESSNGVGNLLLHMAGNVRQWIVSGVGGAEDGRDRASEFAEPLQRVCTAQAYGVTVFDAIFHVVEHFSYHTGQIIFAAKWLAEGRVSFYDDRRLNLEK
jgi:uncharacterized damage-inducible protein DinB